MAHFQYALVAPCTDLGAALYMLFQLTLCTVLAWHMKSAVLFVLLRNMHVVCLISMRPFRELCCVGTSQAVAAGAS